VDLIKNKARRDSTRPFIPNRNGWRPGAGESREHCSAAVPPGSIEEITHLNAVLESVAAAFTWVSNKMIRYDIHWRCLNTTPIDNNSPQHSQKMLRDNMVLAQLHSPCLSKNTSSTKAENRIHLILPALDPRAWLQLEITSKDRIICSYSFLDKYSWHHGDESPWQTCLPNNVCTLKLLLPSFKDNLHVFLLDSQHSTTKISSTCSLLGFKKPIQSMLMCPSLCYSSFLVQDQQSSQNLLIKHASQSTIKWRQHD